MFYVKKEKKLVTEQTNNTQTRIFKIGATRVVEDPSTMSGMSNEQVRDLLKTSYPEIANATIRERDENGLRVVEFLPQPGRKG
jgi:PRTRC genetic system protein C